MLGHFNVRETRLWEKNLVKIHAMLCNCPEMLDVARGEVRVGGVKMTAVNWRLNGCNGS